MGFYSKQRKSSQNPDKKPDCVRFIINGFRNKLKALKHGFGKKT